LITYKCCDAEEEQMVFFFKEVTSNVLISTRYIYRIYRGIPPDSDDEDDPEEGG
jgi:hypothetical protein